MTSNFSFLQKDHPIIHENARKAELNGIIDPRVACMYARFTLEAALKWMYDNDEELEQPWEKTLSAMLKERSFTSFTPPHILKSCEIIRKQGNVAVHEQRKVHSQTSIFVVQELHNVLHWFYRLYFDTDLKGKFQTDLIPSGEQVKTSLAQVAELRKKAEQEEQKHAEELQALAKEKESLEEELKAVRLQLLQNKEKANETPDDHDYNEAQTRRVYIDMLLAEAGWHVGNPDVTIEEELDGVERNKDRTGTGFADYVLWGDDGKPLAVVEAKRASVDAEQGKEQARDYANALEERPNSQRPIIFYTNGYNTFVWDDLFYPPEQIHGFYKKEELQRLINRRDLRVENLADVPIDESIAGGSGRVYQKLAIKAVGEHLQERHKRALVVMATGTGKTRTTIALIKQLQQANWTKRTLFLCDRISLLNQAKRAFTQLLPDTPPVDLRKDKGNTTARICLSTYGTMMGLIDEVKNGTRLFGPGHFDLIVVDEAHRSVYQKYGAIFDYFDSLLVGLTATPKKEIDKNTYELFRVQDEAPVYNYTLEEAVEAEFLVDFEAVKVSSFLSRNGLVYADLDDDKKEEYELHFTDEETGEIPEQVDKKALNDWLFNIDTVDGFLKKLMTEGIKVDGGDMLGKTIIFAKNKDHAEFIVKRFDANYPKHAGHFCKRIDYSLGKDAEVLIEKFGSDSYPQIAVSVDMLDTGIDVPACVNLVFAKPVYSNTKFWQMIGRGTRLCKDLFGPGMDKEKFKIFDCCENFEYFEEFPQGAKGSVVEPISQKIFTRSLMLAKALSTSDNPEEKTLRTATIDFLHNYVTEMEEDNFIVRPQIEFVRKYNDRDLWNVLDESKVSEITNSIAPLPSEMELDDQDAKQWDLLLLNTQLALLETDPRYRNHKKRVQQVAATICSQESKHPDIMKQLPFIESLTDEHLWEDMNIVLLEEIRRRMRLLIKFIEYKERKKVYSNFKDEHDETEVIDTENLVPHDLKKYRQKMESIITKMVDENNLTLYKLRHNQPITELDLEELDRQLFSQEEERELFVKVFASKVHKKWADLENPPLSLLIRSIVGLDKKDVELLFSDFVSNTDLKSKQYRFVQKVIEFMTVDGYISPAMLYEPPFTDIHHGGPDEVFGDAKTDKLFDIIQNINKHALECAG